MKGETNIPGMSKVCSKALNGNYIQYCEGMSYRFIISVGDPETSQIEKVEGFGRNKEETKSNLSIGEIQKGEDNQRESPAEIGGLGGKRKERKKEKERVHDVNALRIHEISALRML
ncbi:hypothetical protein F2Q68_00028248 [Brassica cretica]|nr:hypothetical protein F2Q68_00028248 [Brassica cretica]